jgi:hypothetical protein
MRLEAPRAGFPGGMLFKLKVEQGFPLELALDRIAARGIRCVDWIDLIETARADGWLDFQTFDMLRHAIGESMFPKHGKEAVLDGFKAYVLANPQQ